MIFRFHFYDFNTRSAFFLSKKINWDSLHARLNSHYVALSYTKKKHKKIKAYRESIHLDHGFWKTYGLENVLWCTNVRAPKASSGERCAHRNFVLLVTLGSTCVSLIVHLAAYQMKQITLKDKCWNKFRYSCIHQNNLTVMEKIKTLTFLWCLHC